MKPFLVQLSIFCCFILVCPHCARLKISTPSVSQVCSPQQILLKFKEGEGTPTGLRGIAKIKVESPDEKFSVKEIVIAKRPQCLRLETLTPLGHPEFFAATDGRELFLFSPSENKFYQGIASNKNISSLLHINLSLEETVSIILGKVPLIDYDAEQVEDRVKGDLCILKLSSKDERFTQVLKINLNNQKVVASETYSGGEGLILSIKYGGYARIGEMLFPREIIVSLPQDKTILKINYKKIELLSEINPAEFKLTPPEGVEIVTLE